MQTRSNKRQKELARKEKQRAKQERRDERKRERETRAPPAEGVDRRPPDTSAAVSFQLAFGITTINGVVFP